MCTCYRPILTKIPKYCFNTSNGTETITVSILFRRLKNIVFSPPGIGNEYSNSHMLEAHSKSQYSVYNRGPRGTANAQRFFFTGGPSVVGKLPCNALAFVWALPQAELLSPCHHPPVSSLLRRICSVGRTMAPPQLQAARTHKRKRLGRRLYLAKGTTAHPQCTIPNAVHSATAFLWPWRCASGANSGALEVSTGPPPHETACVSCGDCSYQR